MLGFLINIMFLQYFGLKNDKFNNITINNDPSTGKDFATYLASVGDLVFINTSLKEKYPSDNFNKFKKIMKQGGATDSVIKNLPIDQSGSNSITYTKSYYDATKTNWKKRKRKIL